MNKTTLLWISVGVVVVALLAWFAMQDAGQVARDIPEGEGRVVVAATDAAVSLENVNGLNVALEKVTLHSEGEAEAVLLNEVKAMDLIELKSSGNLALVADTTVEAGTYDELRLTLSEDVTVETDTEASATATVPFNTLVVEGNFVVNEGRNAAVTVDFLAENSLHVTTDGQFVFAPAVDVESRSNADVDVSVENDVQFSNGNVDTDVMVGVDLSGNMGTDVTVDPNARVEFVDGVLQVTAGSPEDREDPEERERAEEQQEAENNARISAREASQIAVNEGHIDTSTSVVMVMEGDAAFWKVTGRKGLEVVNVYVNSQTGAVARVE